MTTTEWLANGIHVTVEGGAVHLIVTTDVGSETVVEEIAIRLDDPSAVAAELEAAVSQIRSTASTQAA